MDGSPALRSLLVALILAAGPACSSQEPIVIGLAGPFSELRGLSMRRAAELAVNEVNRAGGIAGRELQLLAADDSGNAQAAVRIAQDFYDNEDVVAVVGHLTSGSTSAAATVYNAGPTPLLEISPSASNPTVSRAGPYTFRVCPTDLVHGTQLAGWAARQLDATRAAVLYQNDNYGRGVRRSFIEAFLGTGGDIVIDQPFTMELPGVTPYLRLLIDNGGADVLLIAGSANAAAMVFPALDTVDLGIQVLGGDGLSGIQTGSDAAEGVLISTAYLPDRPGERNESFVTTYRAAYGNDLPDHRGAGAYDAVHLLADALRAVGADRRRLRDYVAGIGRERPPFEGVTGTIAFDQNGDVPAKEVVVGVVVGEQLVTAPGR